MTKDQSHAEEEAKLRAERIKLEEEHQNIKQQLLEVQKTKEEAELAKKAAMAEVAELRAQQEAVAADKAQQETITGELKVAQAKLNKASVEIAQAQQAQVKAVAAKNEKEDDLKKKKAAEESLREQMQADLSQFKREIEEEEQAYANSNTIMEKMRRIRESAEAAKKETKEKDSGLLDDIAAQLGDDD
ncbi:MAG: hypothetical protein GKR93_15860 [Gammaproteobacteria bacterium]|nr:hypothetical protein [Gammaproteobacteria bacterium]